MLIRIPINRWYGVIIFSITVIDASIVPRKNTFIRSLILQVRKHPANQPLIRSFPSLGESKARFFQGSINRRCFQSERMGEKSGSESSERTARSPNLADTIFLGLVVATLPRRFPFGSRRRGTEKGLRVWFKCHSGLFSFIYRKRESSAGVTYPWLPRHLASLSPISEKEPLYPRRLVCREWRKLHPSFESI